MINKFFITTVVFLYWCIWINIHQFHFQVRRGRLLRRDFSVLRKHNTITNKIILYLLNEYKYVSRKKKESKRECNYYYYTKRFCIVMTFLSIPWLVIVYLNNWYLTKNLAYWHFWICCSPTLALCILNIIFDIKLKLYSIKEKTNKKQ